MSVDDLRCNKEHELIFCLWSRCWQH